MDFFLVDRFVSVTLQKRAKKNELKNKDYYISNYILRNIFKDGRSYQKSLQIKE